jgi:hypothetical protein
MSLRSQSTFNVRSEDKGRDWATPQAKLATYDRPAMTGTATAWENLNKTEGHMGRVPENPLPQEPNPRIWVVLDFIKAREKTIILDIMENLNFSRTQASSSIRTLKGRNLIIPVGKRPYVYYRAA